MKNSLMIVAHPDDELFWGWKEIEKKEDNWTIVCLTNGGDAQRKLKFQKVCSILGCKYIILNFPDNAHNLTWDLNLQMKIKNIIYKQILQNNIFNKIVTHNQDGEYGHYHHKITSKIVTDIIETKYNTNNLYYFNFNLSKKQEVSDLFKECLHIYFEDPYIDETINGHIKLSEISDIVLYKDFHSCCEYNEQFYPKWFLQCNLLTYDKYL
jgi:LmbE family N-acetylglucosaminyl deacetylase